MASFLGDFCSGAFMPGGPAASCPMDEGEDRLLLCIDRPARILRGFGVLMRPKALIE